MSNNTSTNDTDHGPNSQTGTNRPSSSKWVFDPVILVDLGDETAEDVLQSKSLLVSTLDCIQDGVSILDTELNVKYVNNSMKNWYSLSGDFIGLKCFQIYHNRTQPCENCPVLHTLAKKSPHIGVVKYSLDGLDIGWQQLFAIPILDKQSDLVGVLEYVRDISYQYQLENDLRCIMEKYQSLEKRNAAIAQLLAERRKERDELEETISQNFEKFVKPSLNYLRSKSDVDEVNLVESLIEEIVYPISKKRTSILDKLTPREIQIATLIREGKTTAEIAKTLTVSNKTIDFHRANIRKKLGLQTSEGERINLETYLNAHN